MDVCYMAGQCTFVAECKPTRWALVRLFSLMNGQRMPFQALFVHEFIATDVAIKFGLFGHQIFSFFLFETPLCCTWTCLYWFCFNVNVFVQKFQPEKCSHREFENKKSAAIKVTALQLDFPFTSAVY